MNLPQTISANQELMNVENEIGNLEHSNSLSTPEQHSNNSSPDKSISSSSSDDELKNVVDSNFEHGNNERFACSRSELENEDFQHNTGGNEEIGEEEAEVPALQCSGGGDNHVFLAEGTMEIETEEDIQEENESANTGFMMGSAVRVEHTSNSCNVDVSREVIFG